LSHRVNDPAVRIFTLFLLATLPLAQAGAQAEKGFAGTWTIETEEAPGTTDGDGHWNLAERRAR
jgi:hypothetical protein